MMRIAVLTCDKYNFLAPYFWHFFKKNFPQNTYQVDFVTETEKIYFGDNVFYGGKSLWSDLLNNYLNTVDDDKILLFFDDYMIYGVDFEKLLIAETLCKDNIGCINLIKMNSTKVLVYPDGIDGFLTKDFNSTITTGCQVTIWQKQYLKDVYLPGLDSWKSETTGYRRMKTLGKKVLYSTTHIFKYVHGGCMIKGNRVDAVFNEMAEKW